MAQVPTFENRIAVPTSPGPARMDVAALPQTAAAARGDENLTNALEGASSKFMAAFDQRYDEARRQADAAQVVAGATQQLGDAQFKWSREPDRIAAVAGFDADAKKLRDDTLASVKDPLIASYFTQHFDNQTVMRRLDTQTAAFGLESSMRRGQLDTRLQTYAQQAATSTNDLIRAQVNDLVTADIKGSVAAGWLQPEAGDQQLIRFKSRVDEVKARSLLTADPDQAMAALADPRVLPNLDEKQRVTLYDTASRRSIAAAEKKDRDADRVLKKLEEDVGKTGYALMTDGKLSRGWIDANKYNLSKSDYAGFLKALDPAAEAQKDSPQAVAELEPRLDTADISADITRAFKNGDLSVNTYRSMMERNRALLKDDQPTSPFKSGRELVKTTLDPGQILSGPAERIARAGLAQALVEYDNWTLENQKAGRGDTMRQAQDVVRRYQVVQYDQMSLATGMPRGYAGERSKIDATALDAAESAIVRDLAAGRISKETAEHEGRKIETWRHILAAKPAPGSK